MKILVTGASGQLGRAMRERLESRLPGMTTYATRAELDLTDRDRVAQFIAEGAFSHIVNCAAYTDVEQAESDPQACRAANVTAVGNLASAARDNEVRILHISTDYVFDGSQNTPYTESDRVNPLSEYGRSKRAGEMMMLDMAPEGIIIRTAGVFAPWGHNFVRTMAGLAMRDVRPKVVIDQLGAPTYALDLADAIVTILRSARWIGGIYNYSNMGVTSWYDIAVEIFKLYGKDEGSVSPILSRDYPTAAQRPAYSVLDKSLIRSTYGVEIPHWRSSLARCVAAMKAGS